MSAHVIAIALALANLVVLSAACSGSQPATSRDRPTPPAAADGGLRIVDTLDSTIGETLEPSSSEPPSTEADAAPPSSAQPEARHADPGPEPIGPLRWEPVESAYATCGRRAGFPNAGAFQSDECAAIDRRWQRIPRTDTRCSSDDECEVVLGAGNCPLVALNHAALTDPRYAELPCGDPVAGPCDGSPTRAFCRRGCCVAHRMQR